MKAFCVVPNKAAMPGIETKTEQDLVLVVLENIMRHWKVVTMLTDICRQCFNVMVEAALFAIYATELCPPCSWQAAHSLYTGVKKGHVHLRGSIVWSTYVFIPRPGIHAVQ